MSDDRTRRDELAAGLSAVHARVERACVDAGRDPAELTLIVVTKFFPVSDVLALHDLGVRHYGENRDQEAREKFAQARAALADRDREGLVLHFIGQLQTNKAGHVAAYADVVQSVDRLRLVSALDRGARAANRRLDVLVQVDLDTDARDPNSGGHRGGVQPEEAAELADAVAGHDRLQLRGVMAVAPLGADPDVAFSRLHEVADGIRERHGAADWISAGMSGDLEAAVRHGATHLRVGTAILGSRPSLL